MAIAFDAATTSSESKTATLTFSHTVGVGENRLIVVGIFAVNNSKTNLVSCASVTYNGVSMTKARADQIVGSGNYSAESSLWILANPASGAHNVVATITNYFTHAGVSVSYTGCAQVSTPDAVNGKTGTAYGSQTFDVTTVADNCWVVAIGGVDCNASGATFVASDTSRGTLNIYDGYDRVRMQDTNGAVTPAGARTIGFTLSNSNIIGFAMTGASIAPVAAASDPEGSLIGGKLIRGGLLLHGVLGR